MAIDDLGRRLGHYIVPATLDGYKDLDQWANSLGVREAYGIEGTGSYGAGLCRFLQSRDQRVVEVNRPDRSTRRSRGKSDPIDAELAARAVLAKTATAIPKVTDDRAEVVRLLCVARQGAIKAKTAAAVTLQSTIVTCPTEMREEVSGLSTIKLIRHCSRLRSYANGSVTSATKVALVSIARRYEYLEKEVTCLDKQLHDSIAQACPNLMALFGVGPQVAATLLVAAGENPERLHSETSFASLCGTSPVPASSGKTNRHRLSRGGNRHANAAIYTVVLTRLAHDERTQKYMAKRIAEGKSKREVIRCLKRYIARETYYALLNDRSHRIAQKAIAETT